VPNSYVVDPEACLWVQSGGKKCGACVKKCAKNAIHLDAVDEVEELTVGSIIVATGYEPLDAGRVERYGYGRFPNILTALEFERLTNASGPTGGKVLLKEKKLNKRTKEEEWVFDPENAKPKSVAVIHCVGSRDRNYNAYCSRVCCMYSLKFAHLVKDKLEGAEVSEFYIDMRAFGKNYEDFFERVKEEGVFVNRGRTTEVVERTAGWWSGARTSSTTG
jgi:heterodisulfide reductase subunit A